MNRLLGIYKGDLHRRQSLNKIRARSVQQAKESEKEEEEDQQKEKDRLNKLVMFKDMKILKELEGTPNTVLRKKSMKSITSKDSKITRLKGKNEIYKISEESNSKETEPSFNFSDSDLRIAYTKKKTIVSKKSNLIASKSVVDNYMEKKSTHRKTRIIQENKIKLELSLTILSFLMNFIFFLVFATETFFDSSDPQSQNTLEIILYIEFVLNFYFIYELIYEIYINFPDKKFWYFLNFFTIVDIVTIFWIFLNYFYLRHITVNMIAIRFFRFLKFLKRIRTVKNLLTLTKRMTTTKEFTSTLNPLKMQFFEMGMTFLIFLLIGSGLILTIQDFIDDSFSVKNMNFLDAFYFTIVSVTTLGYGDILPTGVVSRLIIVLFIFFMVYFISEQIGKIISILQIWGIGVEKYEERDHLVIFCNSLNNLESFVKTVKENNDEIPILFISDNELQIKILQNRYNKIDLMICSFNDETLFSRANLYYCKEIFIFSNYNYNESSIMREINFRDKIDYNNNLENLLLLQLFKINQECKNIPINVFSVNLQKFGFKFPTLAQMRKQITALAFNKYDFLTNKNKLDKIRFKYFKDITSKIYIKLNEENYDLNDYSMVKRFYSLRKIKNCILAKSSINPGFLTFIQNLIFIKNTEDHHLDRTLRREKGTILSEYFTSLYNVIDIHSVPERFYGYRFLDFMKTVYFSSMYDYHAINSNRIKFSSPIIPIGIVEDKPFILQKFESKKKFLLFPYDYKLTKETLIVSIINGNNNNTKLIFDNMTDKVFSAYKKNEQNDYSSSILEKSSIKNEDLMSNILEDDESFENSKFSKSQKKNLSKFNNEENFVLKKAEKDDILKINSYKDENMNLIIPEEKKETEINLLNDRDDEIFNEEDSKNLDKSEELEIRIGTKIKHFKNLKIENDEEKKSLSEDQIKFKNFEEKTEKNIFSCPEENISNLKVNKENESMKSENRLDEHLLKSYEVKKKKVGKSKTNFKTNKLENLKKTVNFLEEDVIKELNNSDRNDKKLNSIKQESEVSDLSGISLEKENSTSRRRKKSERNNKKFNELINKELMRTMTKFNYSQKILTKQRTIADIEDQNEIKDNLKKEIEKTIKKKLNSYYTFKRTKPKTELEKLQKNDPKTHKKLKIRRRITKIDLEISNKHRFKKIFNEFDKIYNFARESLMERKHHHAKENENEDVLTMNYLKRADVEKQINKQKLNLIEEDITLKFQNHILIFEFEVFDYELVEKLFIHHQNSKICLIGDYETGNEEEINRYLSKNKNLYYVIIDPLNPEMLEKLNLDKVLKCFLLLKQYEKNSNTDMLNLQLINFFNYNNKFEIFMEQNNENSNLILGYTPILNERVFDKLYHPLYMSGKILYISKISEVFSYSYINEYIADAWLSLIYCGYPDQSYYKLGTFPNIITIDLPKCYDNKYYIDLMKDFFSLDFPSIPLGIHVMEPLTIKKDFKSSKNLTGFNNYKMADNDFDEFQDNLIEESNKFIILIF